VDRFVFEAEVWLWEARAAWHFVTVPEEISDDIEARAIGQERGFGSVRVRVTVGGTTWSTSVFPDDKRGVYTLPLKKEVRQAEGISAGDRVSLQLELVEL
jgi:hypothetical protein